MYSPDPYAEHCRSVRRLLWALLLTQAIGLLLVAATTAVGYRVLDRRVDETERRAAFRSYLRDPQSQPIRRSGDPTNTTYAATMIESDERLWQQARD